MPEMTRRTWLTLSAFSTCSAVLLAGESGREPARARSTPRDAIRDRYFPNVTLTTQEGRRVRFYDDLIKEKIVTINLIYATCDKICPTVTANLAKVQKLLGNRVGRDIFMYSITLKPEVDTPEVLHQYAATHGAGPGWLFLTGKPDDVELLRRKLGFVDPDPIVDADKSSHAGNVRYGNEALQLWAACPGLANPEWIAKSISWVAAPRLQGGKRPSGGETKSEGDRR